MSGGGFGGARGGGGRSSSGGGGSVRRGTKRSQKNPEKEQKRETAHSAQLTGTVLMRYYTESENNIATFRAALEKVEGVKNVSFDAAARTFSFAWRGSYAGLVEIQNKAVEMKVPSELISHAYLVLEITPKEDDCDEESLKKALQPLKGIRRVCCVNDNIADLWVDLREIDLQAVVKTMEDSKFKAELRSHETVVLTAALSDKLDAFVQSLLERSGIMVATREADRVVLQTRRRVSDFALRDRARLADVEVTSIERK